MTFYIAEAILSDANVNSAMTRTYTLHQLSWLKIHLLSH